MRATGNGASLKVAQAFSQRNRWKKYLICQQQNKGIQLHIPDTLLVDAVVARSKSMLTVVSGAVPTCSKRSLVVRALSSSDALSYGDWLPVPKPA